MMSNVMCTLLCMITSIILLCHMVHHIEWEYLFPRRWPDCQYCQLLLTIYHLMLLAINSPPVLTGAHKKSVQTRK